ncbi:MAG: TIGR03086 family metal-binding protein [Candidatus Saccharibacteria bacterium]
MVKKVEIMDAKELFARCLTSATRVISRVTPQDYARPTPCTDWSVLQLVSHILYELYWTADIVSGKKIKEVGTRYDGDLIGTNLQTSWLVASNRATNAIEQADNKDKARLSWGTSTVGYYLKQAAVDQLVHAWDLSTALGAPIRFDDDVSRVLYDYAMANGDQISKTGLFAPEVKVTGDADIQTKILAMYGRDVAQEKDFEEQ